MATLLGLGQRKRAKLDATIGIADDAVEDDSVAARTAFVEEDTAVVLVDQRTSDRYHLWFQVDTVVHVVDVAVIDARADLGRVEVHTGVLALLPTIEDVAASENAREQTVVAGTKDA